MKRVIFATLLFSCFGFANAGKIVVSNNNECYLNGKEVDCNQFISVGDDGDHYNDHYNNFNGHYNNSISIIEGNKIRVNGSSSIRSQGGGQAGIIVIK